MTTLRYEPEIATQGCPRRYAHDYPPSGRNSRSHSPRAMLMLNYQTNARNGALVRFNPPVRSRRAPRPASPRLPSIPLPSPHHPAQPAFPSPPPTMLHFAPHLHLRPAPCSVPRPARFFALTVLGFVPALVGVPAVAGFAAPAPISAWHHARTRGPSSHLRCRHA